MKYKYKNLINSLPPPLPQKKNMCFLAVFASLIPNTPILHTQH